jgi:hypothetical protein
VKEMKFKVMPNVNSSKLPAFVKEIEGREAAFLQMMKHYMSMLFASLNLLRNVAWDDVQTDLNSQTSGRPNRMCRSLCAAGLIFLSASRNAVFFRQQTNLPSFFVACRHRNLTEKFMIDCL